MTDRGPKNISPWDLLPCGSVFRACLVVRNEYSVEEEGHSVRDFAYSTVAVNASYHGSGKLFMRTTVKLSNMVLYCTY